MPDALVYQTLVLVACARHGHDIGRCAVEAHEPGSMIERVNLTPHPFLAQGFAESLVPSPQPSERFFIGEQIHDVVVVGTEWMIGEGIFVPIPPGGQFTLESRQRFVGPDSPLGSLFPTWTLVNAAGVPAG